MRNKFHKEHKRAIRTFLKDHYSDERLVMLLAHAKDGKLNYSSCCCLIGITTADHALQTMDRCQMVGSGTYDHLYYAKLLSGAIEAEKAFLCLGFGDEAPDRNKMRNRILVPMIRSEMRRRDASRKRIEWKQELVEMST